MSFRNKTLGSFLCLAFYVVQSASGAVSYNVIDLGRGIPRGINNLGQVVGTISSSGWHAFLYDNGTMTDIHSAIEGATNSPCAHTEAMGINDAGQIVGFAQRDALVYITRAFVYSHGTATSLMPSGGYVSSGAKAINSSGQVAITASTTIPEWYDGYYHAFIYSNATWTDLGTLPGGTNSEAYAINVSGQVVGKADTASSTLYPFLFTNGVMAKVSNVPGDASLCYASGINDSGQVIGVCGSTGFLYSNGVTTNLTGFGDTYFSPCGINNGGQVVGTTLQNHAFFYSNGIMSNLNSLISPASGFTIQGATGINDRGQIIAYGSTSTDLGHAFLLTPIPEPSTLAILGIGLTSFIAVAWRQQSSKKQSE